MGNRTADIERAMLAALERGRESAGFYVKNPMAMVTGGADKSEVAKSARAREQAVMLERANAALQAQLKSVEARADAWARQAIELQKAAETYGGMANDASETLRMLLEAMAGIHTMLRGLEWRKRRADKEEYCPSCDNLKSTFGGAHAPRCQLSGALQLTAPTKWKLMRRPAQKPSPREA